MCHKVIYIMGVSGSGKTTIGQRLSAETGYPFYDADDFHSMENIARMNAGIPLTDNDRLPWLKNIHDFVAKKITTHDIIFVCSALKQQYRDFLSDGIENRCRWVFLSGDYHTIEERLKGRTDHYMPLSLLQSQFDALEIPANSIMIDIKLSPEDIVDSIILKTVD